MTGDKITVPARGAICGTKIFGVKTNCAGVAGYEIHLGETVYENGCEPFAKVFRLTNAANEIIDGAVSTDGKTIGTYLHGLFDADDFRHEFIKAARRVRQLNQPQKLIFYQSEKEERYDRLAAHVRQSVNLKQIFSWYE